MIKDDERELAKRIFANGGTLPTDYPVPMPEKRIGYILEKWAEKDWWDYGVSAFRGWFTIAGYNAALQMSAAWTHELPLCSGFYHVAERLQGMRTTMAGSIPYKSDLCHMNVPVRVDPTGYINIIVEKPWRRVRVYSRPMSCVVFCPAYAVTIDLPQYPETFTWEK